MSNVTGVGLISSVDLYTSNTQPSGAYVGQQVYSGGKQFVYALAGASNLVAGTLLQAPSVTSGAWIDLATPAGSTYAIGYNAVGLGVVVTNGATVVTAGQFAGGSLVDSNGYEYTIMDNTADAVGNAAITLYLDRTLNAAWTGATTTVSLTNLYNKVIIAPTTLTGAIVGIAIYPLTAAQYGWIQVAGTAPLRMDATANAVGSAVGNSTTTAGDGTAFVAGTGSALVGSTAGAASSAKFRTINLNLV